MAMKILMLASAALLALSTSAKKVSQTPFKDEINEHDKKVIEFYLSGARGFWFGFHKTFYHNKKTLDKNCLSMNDEKYINRVLNFMAYGELTEIF